MTKDELLRLAVEVMEGADVVDCDMRDAITNIKAALEAKDENVAVKNMMRWVDGLKRQSDNGQHMNIPSSLSAGTCWELANELEQFINTTPPQRTWVGLTDEELAEFSDIKLGNYDLCLEVEAKLKEKNT